MATRYVAPIEILAAVNAARGRENPDFLYERTLPDGRHLCLMPLLTGVRLGIAARQGDLWFTNVWDYPNYVGSLYSVAYGHAFVKDGWRAALGWDGDGEPEGWYRDGQSDRRWPTGYPARKGGT